MAGTLHQSVVAWAEDHIGYAEVPAGSNRGPFVEFCQSHTWLKGTGWPWCAAFAVTAIEEGAGVKYPDPTAGAWDLLARAAKRGWAAGPTEWKRVQPGDLVVFNIGSGHVGVVERIDGKGVTSIDGNASDMVKRCVRPLSTVRGFVRWPDELPGRARSPLFHVVGSESGTRKLRPAGPTVSLPSKDKVT